MNSKGYEVTQKLESLLRKMDIPSNRKHINLNNLKWLNRNLGIRNSNNPKFEEAMNLIKESILNKYYTY